MKTIHKDLDLRERWLGIRKLKKDFKPMPYYRRDIEGHSIPKHQQAQQIAELWANTIWKAPTTKAELHTSPIITKDLIYDTTKFTIGELIEVQRN